MIELHWETELPAIIIWNFSPGWTWNDFHLAIDGTGEMIRERALPVPVDLILLMDKAVSFPPGSPFAAIGRGMREISTLDGIVVAVVRNQFQRTVINVVRYGVADGGTRLYAATSLDEARQIVTQYRQTKVS